MVKRKIFSFSFLFMAVVAIIFAVVPLNSEVGALKDENSITLYGEAKAAVMPDIAKTTVRIKACGSTKESSMFEVKSIYNQIVQSTKNVSGIKSLYTNRCHDCDGYVSNLTFKITSKVSELDSLKNLINENISIDYAELSLSNYDEIYAPLLVNAVENAKEKIKYFGQGYNIDSVSEECAYQPTAWLEFGNFDIKNIEKLEVVVSVKVKFEK